MIFSDRHAARGSRLRQAFTEADTVVLVRVEMYSRSGVFRTFSFLKHQEPLIIGMYH